MAVPFVDLARLHKPYKDELAQAFDLCLSTSEFILGPTLKAFEDNFAREVRSANAIGVASGTDALLLTLHAIGVGPGDEVVCPAYGFVATADVVLRLGASIVFVDVNEDMTIDVEACREAITEKTKAVIAVHLFGLAADIETLAEIAGDYGLYLVEDCAQSTGGEVNGRALGTFGIAGCYSFYPTKNLGALGDGGMVVTESEDMADRIRLFRDHGRDSEGNYVMVGYNSRLDSIQAALLNVKLESLREDNEDRRTIAQYYDKHLDAEIFTLPPLRDDGSHVYNQYTIRHPERDAIRNFLGERQIESRIYYPQAMPLMPCFEYLGYREGHFPVSESLCGQVFSLPMFPSLTTKEVYEVVHNIDLYIKTHPVVAAP